MRLGVRQVVVSPGTKKNAAEVLDSDNRVVFAHDLDRVEL